MRTRNMTARSTSRTFHRYPDTRASCQCMTGQTSRLVGCRHLTISPTYPSLCRTNAPGPLAIVPGPFAESGRRVERAVIVALALFPFAVARLTRPLVHEVNVVLFQMAAVMAGVDVHADCVVSHSAMI